MEIKATEISEKAIHVAHCLWIIQQAKELKALLSYDSDSMINLNKSRALSALDTIQGSINELRLYIKSL